MSQAPVEASAYTGADRAYAEATIELNRQVDSGTSWSGNERNNVFLNLGRLQGPDKVPDFADASALAGFDFPDDSRGLAALDWDFDGDLDFITTNRTAPRARILENRAVTREASFVSFKLIGTGTGLNRDAIGSRIVLLLKDKDGSEMRLSRSLHAGQGFISQASKWLHFGIPEGAEIVSVQVNWRPYDLEFFDQIKPGSFYSLKRGTGVAAEWQQTRMHLPDIAVTKPEKEESTVMASIERPIPLPSVPYTGLDGKARELPAKSGRAMLINLWATWCAPCLVELADFAEDAEVFRRAGVDVLALCVDVDAADAEARKILNKTGFPFEVGFANDASIERIHMAHNAVFLRPAKLPIPTSLLIRADGTIASVIRGPVHPKDLEAALSALNGSSQDWKAFATGFEGRWRHGPDVVYYVGVAKQLLEGNFVDEAASFLFEHREALEIEGRKYAEMLMLVGTKLLEREQQEQGLKLLRMAVEVAPELSAARNNLAVALLQSGRGDEAVPHLKAAIDSDPDFVDPRVNLARYHVAKQRFDDALKLIEPVLTRQYHPGAIRLKAQILVSQKKIPELYRVFETMVQKEPKEPSTWVNLGKLQLQVNGPAAALASFNEAAELAPDSVEIQTMIRQLRQRIPNDE